MSASWQQILARDEPVVGHLDEFLGAADEFRSFGDSAQHVADEFHKIQFGYTSDKFAGEAADAFRTKIKEISEVVQDLPKVLRGVEGTFTNHAMELKMLRGRADQALARAQTQWGQANTSQDQMDGARLRRERLLQQVEYLDSARDGSPETETQISALRDQADDAQRDLSSAKAAQQRANHALEGIGDEWNRIHGDEDDLNRHTRHALEHQDLWSLGDPSSLEKGLHALGELAKDLWNLGVLGFDLIPDEVLWALHAALEKLSVVLAVVSLLSLIPGLQVLGVVVIGLALLKFAVDGLLYSRGSVNPATGKGISGWRLLFDGAMLLAPMVVKYAVVPKLLSKAGPLTKISRLEQIARYKEIPGLVGDNITLWGAAGEVAGGGSGPADGRSHQAAKCQVSSWNDSAASGDVRLAPAVAA